MNSAFQRNSLNLLFLAGLVVLIGTNFLAYNQIQRLLKVNDWVIHTHLVIAEGNGEQLALAQAFLVVDHAVVTNQPLSSDALTLYLNRAEANQKTLRQLTIDNPPQTARIDKLEKLLKQYRVMLVHVANLYALNDKPQALAAIDNDNVTDIRETTTALVSEIIQEEKFLLTVRNASYQHNIHKSNQIFLVVVTFSLFLFGISLLLLDHYFKQRREAERKKSEGDQRLRLIINGTHDYAILMLNLDGTISTWNTGAEKIYGYQADEVIGKYFADFYPNPDDKHYLSKHALEIARNTGRFEEDYWSARKKGADFLANVVITALYEAGGDVVGFVQFTRDLSEKIKIEKIKKEFVSVVSHELRTPITSIRGALGLLLSGTIGQFGDKANRLLTIANQNCDRLLILINDILDIEKIEEGKMVFQMKLLDIQILVEEAISANKMYAVKFDIDLQLLTNTPGLLVNVDGARLIQVLSNLLSNAIKFSEKKGVVSVEITTVEHFVRVAVSNKGLGIPAAFQKKNFSEIFASGCIKYAGERWCGAWA